MKKVRPLLAVTILTVVVLGSVIVVLSQTPSSDDCRFFDLTGHYVCGEFLAFYDAQGGLEIFGYPLTEAFDDPKLGLRVQYFQRARMEWHPGNSDPYKVQLGLLVDELGYTYPVATPEEIPAFPGASRQYFPETGYVVSDAFLKYFREKGGLEIFGYPRSGMLYEDGRYVQYFQRARMEWQPEGAFGAQVRLTNIGEVYVKRFDIGIDPVIIELRQLDVSASVRYVIVGQQATQTVFVYVTDQHRKPVEGADIVGAVRYQGDATGEELCTFERTDADGFTKCSFEFPASRMGQKVVIDVAVRRGDLTATTQTFFFLWW
jgi:hypothetical protein